MITRPLDLSGRLRPSPRNLDFLFWVNGVLIALFFTFFGSRFVLSPGMGIATTGGILPVLPDAVSGAVATQLQLEVAEGGKLCIDTGFISFENLREWLKERAEHNPKAVLLVKYNVSNSTELLMGIVGVAGEAGISVHLAAVDRLETNDPRELGDR